MVATRKSAARVMGALTGCGKGLTITPHSEDSTETVYEADSAGTIEFHNPDRELATPILSIDRVCAVGVSARKKCERHDLLVI